MSIALNPSQGFIDRSAAAALGGGLGIAAAPKTIFNIATSNNPLVYIYIYYKASSYGVSNTPSK